MLVLWHCQMSPTMAVTRLVLALGVAFCVHNCFAMPPEMSTAQLVEADDLRSKTTLPPEPVFWKNVSPEEDQVPNPEPTDDTKGTYLKSFVDKLVTMLQQGEELGIVNGPGFATFVRPKVEDPYVLWFGMHKLVSREHGWQLPAGVNNMSDEILPELMALLAPVGRERPGDMVEEQMPVKSSAEGAADFDRLLPIRRARTGRLEDASLLKWLDFYLRPPTSFQRRYSSRFVSSDGRFSFWYRFVAIGDPAVPVNIFGTGDRNFTAVPLEARLGVIRNFASFLEGMDHIAVDPRQYFKFVREGNLYSRKGIKVQEVESSLSRKHRFPIVVTCEFLRKGWKKDIRPLDSGIPHRFGVSGSSCWQGPSPQK